MTIDKDMIKIPILDADNMQQDFNSDIKMFVYLLQEVK